MNQNAPRPASSSEPAEALRDTGTVQRVLRLLAALADRPGQASSAVARDLGLPRSSVHRLLAMLRDEGFAAQAVDGTFSPGPELQRIAGRLSGDAPYARLAAPLLHGLTARFGETSVLAVLSRSHLKMFYAAAAFPPDPMRYNLEFNRFEPLLWGATARVILAQLSAAEVSAAIGRGEPSPLDGRPLDEDELRQTLATIRSQGYALSHGHRTRGAVGIAAPFFGGDGEVAGDFGLLIPAFRFDAAKVPAIAAALADAATALSGQLGFDPGRRRAGQ